MSIKYLETDIADEGSIDWYEVDGATYGFTSAGVILDSDGVPLTNLAEGRAALNAVAKYEASK